MERFQELRDKARQNLKFADHMLTVTYPLVRDPKMLLSVLDNIFLSLTHTMGSILHHERLFKRIPHFEDNFQSKFNMFRLRITRLYNINIEYITLIQEVKDLIVEHKKSPVEFSRKDKFVICTNTYKIKTVSVDHLKKYLAKAKLFIQEASNIVSKNEGIFR